MGRSIQRRTKKKIQLTKSNSDFNYFLGSISVTQEITVQPDWFDIEIKVQIGEFCFPFYLFKKQIIKGNREFILPDNTIAILPEEWFEKYGELLTLGKKKENSIRLHRSHFTLLDELEKNNQENSLKKEYYQKKEYTIPSRIKATLRSYQKEGFSWMIHLQENNFGGCLADDMGLGKTLQTITMLQYLYNDTIPNYSSDPFQNQLPDNKDKSTAFNSDKSGQLSLFSTGDTTDFAEINQAPINSTQEVIPASLVVVPTSLLPNWKREINKFSALSVYEYAGSHRLRSKGIDRIFNRFNIIITTYGIIRNDIELLEEYPFECIILDESQNIKNPDSVTYHSVSRLKGKHRLVLTGTPIENSLKDLWAQFNFINPGLLGSSDGFRSHYIIPITKEGNTRLEAKLQRLISPFFLRRTKIQVAPELPALTEEVLYCEMSPQQEDIYKKEKNILRNALLKINNEGGITQNSFIALQGMTRLRLTANHPQMLYPEFKLTSGKMDLIMDTYEMLMSEGHKVLIFSSFVKYLNILAEAFEKRKWRYAMLTGQTADREKAINQFQEKSTCAFFISLKAGGVGLNLTQADYVFIIDPWWNPATEMQAVSRAHRMGQTKQVMVYRFITTDTIEEKIIRLQEQKSKLAESFITTNNPLNNLTDNEWKELLNLD